MRFGGAVVGAVAAVLVIGRPALDRDPQRGAVSGEPAAVVATDGTPTPAQVAMMAALSEMSSGSGTDVRPAWRRALTEYPALRDYHLYYLALANASRGNRTSSQRVLETLLEEESGSVLAPLARLRLGVLLEQEASEVAIGHLQRARGDLPEGGPGWIKASLLLARLELERGQGGAAHRIATEVRRRSGPGVARRRARRIGLAASVADPELSLERPGPARDEALLLLREGDPDAARELIERVLRHAAAADERVPLLETLAAAQYEAGRIDAAEAILDDIVTTHPREEYAPRALLQGATWRWNRDHDAAALERFQDFLRHYPQSAGAADALYAIGRIHQTAGRFDDARKAYGELVQRFSGAKTAPDARWRVCWLAYLEARYAQAAACFDELGRPAGPDQTRESARYWHARSVERSEGASAAGPLFARVLSDFPRGYYAALVERELEGAGAAPAPGGRPSIMNVTRASQAAVRDGAAPAFPALAADPAAPQLDRARFGRAVDLATMGLRRHAVRELDAIRFPPRSQPDAQILLLEAYARLGRYDRIFGASGIDWPREHEAPGHPLDRFVYPRAYWELISRYGGEHDVDPNLVAALIRQESRFLLDAVSPRGARGLMQLMPATAARLAKRVGHAEPGTRDLERPEINIQYGTLYLGELAGQYQASTFKVLAAYNAGERALAKWERRFADVPPDEFVERITYRETRDYVKKVMGNYRVYRILYDGMATADPPVALAPGSQDPGDD
jgi:soluble lytic murein transglycosylase